MLSTADCLCLNAAMSKENGDDVVVVVVGLEIAVVVVALGLVAKVAVCRSRLAWVLKEAYAVIIFCSEVSGAKAD